MVTSGTSHQFISTYLVRPGPVEGWAATGGLEGSLLEPYRVRDLARREGRDKDGRKPTSSPCNTTTAQKKKGPVGFVVGAKERERGADWPTLRS